MKFAIYNHKLINARVAQAHLIYKCPFCGKRMVCHKGIHRRQAYFSHVLSNDSFNNPGETSEHMAGKRQLAQFFNADGNTIAIEKYLPQIHQWPDLMVNDTIIEFQCSPISAEKLTERIAGYSKLHLKSWWILGNPYLKRHLRPAYIAKFLNYSVNLGFFMLFWLIKSNCLEIHYGMSEYGGHLSYHVKKLSTFRAFRNFIQHNQLGFRTINRLNFKLTINSEMNVNRKRLFYGDSILIKLQQMISQRSNTVLGCPIICHCPIITLPIFRNRSLIWRILILLLINHNSDLRRIYKWANLQLGFPMTFCQIHRSSFLYQRAFVKYIRLLEKHRYVSVNIRNKKITKLKEPRWFNSYYDKLLFLKKYY